MRRSLMSLILALAGLILLVALGAWQLQRMVAKDALLAAIDTHIAAEPVNLPANPDPLHDQYLSVRVKGDLSEPHIRVLVSRKQIGAGYRIISPLQIGARRIMVDRGFLPIEQKEKSLVYKDVTVFGNLLWPDETDSFTPENDLANNIWFARDVDKMAAYLGTEPVLVVARETSFNDMPVAPFPVNTAGIPNDHLQYALTWFLLAAVWAAMAGTLLWRDRTKT